MDWDEPSKAPLPPIDYVFGQLQRWLGQTREAGDSLAIENCGLQVDVLAPRSTLKGPAFITSLGDAKFVDAAPLRVKIEEKVTKYQELARSFPFAVAVVLNFSTCLGDEELLTTLTGSAGLFQQHPEMSGCFYLYRADDCDWGTTFIVNRHASMSLAETLWGQLGVPNRAGRTDASPQGLAGAEG